MPFKRSSVSVPDVFIAQKVARYALIGLLALLGAWMLQRFLPALCWAVVLAIGTSSLYDRWLAIFQGKRRHIWAALSFTSIVGIVVIVPLVYGGIVALREAISLARNFLESSKGGRPDLPQWIGQLPYAGPWIQGLWLDYLVHTGPAAVLAKPALYEWTRLLSVQLFGRLSTLAFTLMTLYFVYLNRDTLRNDVPRVGRALFGPTVEGLLTQAAEAIRATVDGIVLVAVAEGAIMTGV
jgi:predicted PurR-regulated permease PerM